MTKIEKEDKNYEYRTLQFRINSKHDLFSYCDAMCFNSKNIYNISNFYIRQAYTGLKKSESDRVENQLKAIKDLNNSIEAINNIKVETFEKRKNYKNVKKEKPKPKLLSLLDENNSFISQDHLDCFFRLINQVDYLSLPSQVNQQTLKVLYQDWKSFFQSLKEYKINPSKFKGCPKPPNYAKKDGRKVTTFTNQNCRIKVEKDKKYLIFPKTNLKLELGNVPIKSDKLKSVRIIPNSNFFVVELIIEVPKSIVKKTKETSKRIISIDLGVSNFVTISNNIGLNPIIIKGNIIKSKNQFYNKERANYYGILRIGKNPNKGQFRSNRLNNIDSNRHAFMKDHFHKISKMIIKYCLENNIDTIVIGKNKDWKSNVQMNKKSKQNFIGIPYNDFINILTYKSNEYGLLVIETEESYTSKASFIDNDDIPTYSVNDATANFSGERIKRGLYQSKEGILINADVNGACNILKKVFKDVFDGINIKYILNSPKVLDII